MPVFGKARGGGGNEHTSHEARAPAWVRVTARGRARPRAAVGRGCEAWLVLLAFVSICPGLTAQTNRFKLSDIIPGTEHVQLVLNGDFQSQGAASPTNTHPSPTGWTRQGNTFADPGTNMVVADSGVVARASVGVSVSQYKQTLTLQQATDYVLSAYLWNMGDSASHVTTVIDLNDAPQEPQITLSYSDAMADQGYFVSRPFNTTNTGTTVTVRAFYDNPVGAGAAAKYSPLAAQWDNIAITPLAEFLPPLDAGSSTNQKPTVSVTSPPDGANLVFTNPAATLAITADAFDPDGSVTRVEFFANANKLGESSASPYRLLWSNLLSGTWQLTAVATDNTGGSTRSAPVTVSLTVPLPPQVPALSIAKSGANYALYWPTSLTALTLQCASNLASPDWRVVTNSVGVSSNQNVVGVAATAGPRFFRLSSAVDPSTLNRKLLMGYQGWFACPGDGSPMDKWVHWFSTQVPVATNATVDFWPDVSELDPDELFATGMTMPDGSPAKVYAAWNQKTVVRHFKWMKDNNLDGVFLQRFTSELSNSKNFGWRNQVAVNVRIGAETYGRVYGIMYDISGQNASTLISTLTNDWLYLVNTLQITNSPRYIWHKGKPVVTIWGFGFLDRPGTPQDAITLIDWFKAAGCSVMGGVPTYWRTLDHDSQTNATWADAYRTFDIISPWSVTRFRDTTGADNFKVNQLIPDREECVAHGLDYMPVLFPGFSWHNLKPTYPLNDIPRNRGTFYWRQVYNAVSAGCTMLYGAMFDEMNEGTSMFKLAPTPAQLPAQGTFVPLNIDGGNLPSDWYLRVADQAGRMLRREIPLQPLIPITP